VGRGVGWLLVGRVCSGLEGFVYVSDGLVSYWGGVCVWGMGYLGGGGGWCE